tara:strand:- start:511 stop:822 length:312 start_codon:yes stop_codon:yes gene_type:complete
MTYEEKLESEKEIYNLEEFTKFNTGVLYDMVNDFTWRDEMWFAQGMKNKNMLYKQYWITQKSIMKYLYDVWEAEPSLYTDCVKNVVTDKKALRELAKQIIPNL